MSDRLFFALWPDTALLQALHAPVYRIMASVEGKPQSPGQWHVTLEFLGQVPRERQPALRAAARIMQRHDALRGFLVQGLAGFRFKYDNGYLLLCHSITRK